MRINGPEFLRPVFDFLDGIARDYGDILFMLFTYAAIPFLVWVLCGGLRRKLLAGKRGTNVPSVTVIYLPLGLSRPPTARAIDPIVAIGEQAQACWPSALQSSKRRQPFCRMQS
jgi:hypothetical protein